MANILFRIYNKYFMLVPIEDIEYRTFFYILKQQIQCNKEKGQRKIFVPISNIEYSRKISKKNRDKQI